jgi:4-amino-4-deoxy-L-arabinose transferase-like glycosyltransferase
VRLRCCSDFRRRVLGRLRADLAKLFKMIFAPVFSLGIFGVLFWFSQDEKDRSLRLSILKSCIFHGVLVSYSVELLSLGQFLTAKFMSAMWASLLGLGLCLLISRLSSRRSRAILKDYSIARYRSLDFDSRLWITIMFLILALRLGVALIAPPNNFDSMTYHLPRAMHWIQNQSVAHYPTPNPRQIAFPPGPAFLTMQTQLLVGSDRWVNVVQWLAWFSSVLSISWLTQKLGAPSAQWIAGVIAVSVPMGVLQSATTQSDLVATFCVVALACFTLPKTTLSIQDGFWIGAALGLAALTKPTSLLFSFPLIVLLIYKLARLKKLTTITPQTILTSLIVAATLPAMSYWRNWQTFGSILGDNTGTINEKMGLASTLSNALRLFYMNFPLPGLKGLVLSFHDSIIKLDANDPLTTFQGESFSSLSSLIYLAPHEDFVSSPLHWLLGLMALTWIYFRLLKCPSKQVDRNLASLATVVVINIALFCVLLKWQPWGNRLILGTVVLMSPVIAHFIESFNKAGFRRMRVLIILLAAAMALLYSLTSVRNPVIPLPLGEVPSKSIINTSREDLYFDNSQTGRVIKSSYLSSMKTISTLDCYDVGLALNVNDWEYPFWRFLPTVRFWHVSVDNPSRSSDDGQRQSHLCAIVHIERNNNQLSLPDENWQRLKAFPILKEPESGQAEGYVVVYKSREPRSVS